MITPEIKRLIQESLQRLAASPDAVAQIEQTVEVLVKALELNPPDDGGTDGDAKNGRPVADPSTFCVNWRGRSCFLGNTLLFWMFERLARSPNRCIAPVDLLDDVWRGERQSSTIRGVAKRLRDRLVAAGMPELAAAIDGSVSGYYRLILV